MRALTLTQPWAGLVASGIKLVENRPRRIIARADFGKRFAIHASREIDESVYHRIAEVAPDILTIERPKPDVEIHTVPCFRDWYRFTRDTSAVIGVATLDSVLDPLAHGIMPHEPDAAAALPRDQRRWFFGPIGYVLRDVIALPTPVPCRGWQGFWTLPALVEAQVMTQLARAA